MGRTEKEMRSMLIDIKGMKLALAVLKDNKKLRALLNACIEFATTGAEPDFTDETLDGFYQIMRTSIQSGRESTERRSQSGTYAAFTKQLQNNGYLDSEIPSKEDWESNRQTWKEYIEENPLPIERTSTNVNEREPSSTNVNKENKKIKKIKQTRKEKEATTETESAAAAVSFPSFNDVELYFQSKGKTGAREFFEEMNRAGWTDAERNPIRYWELYADKWEPSGTGTGTRRKDLPRAEEKSEYDLY